MKKEKPARRGLSIDRRYSKNMFCIKCNVELDEKNWAPECLRNHINKCRLCIKEEKRIYARAWRILHPESQKVRSKKYKTNLKLKYPAKWKARNLLGLSKRRAKLLGLEFNLDFAFLHTLIVETPTCKYFKWPINTTSSKQKDSASLDRIDSFKGYTKDNVQIISYLANLMKSNATKEELNAFAKGILSHEDC